MGRGRGGGSPPHDVRKKVMIQLGVQNLCKNLKCSGGGGGVGEAAAPSMMFEEVMIQKGCH